MKIALVMALLLTGSAAAADRSWKLFDGALVATSGADGAGGYENEGQSLRVEDTAAHTTTLVVQDYFTIKDVTGATSKKGARAVLVQLMDGMSDAPHVAVVDPKRGTVWRKTFASVTKCEGGQLEIATYREKDFEDHDSGAGARAKPSGAEKLDLDKLLGGAVIKLEPMR